MADFVEKYWNIRLADLAESLEENNFEAVVVSSVSEAGQYIIDKVVPECKPQSVAFGGSMTLVSSGVVDQLNKNKSLKVISPNAPGISDEEKYELRRQGLLADLYLTGTNAVTANGELINLDMIGNRIAALTFGPKKVVVLMGRNKLVPDVESAMIRIKEFTAPANSMRLDFKTPCVKTAGCMDCKGSQRICNTWTITEKSFPKKRVTVILINEDIGL